MEREKLEPDGSSSESSEDSRDAVQQWPGTEMQTNQVALLPANHPQHGNTGGAVGGAMLASPGGGLMSTEAGELSPYHPATVCQQAAAPSVDYTLAGGTYEKVNIGGTHNVEQHHNIQQQQNVQQQQNIQHQNIQYVTNIMQPTAVQRQAAFATSPTSPREQILSEQQHEAEPDTIQLPGGIIMYEKDPINRQSRIFRAKIRNQMMGDIDIVIKILPDGERERREARLHFRVPGHPQIIHRFLTDIFMYRGLSSIFMAMELCDRLNLHLFIRDEKKHYVPFNFVLYFSFAKQIVIGLEFLHSQGVMHRDLKPHNLLLASNRTVVKISDFGLSKHVTSDQTSATQSMIQPGTDGWKSPEVLMNAERIFTSADIFSLALVVYHTLSYGEHPFGNNQYSWNHYIVHNQNLNLGGLRVPNAELAVQMLTSMLDPDPTKRPKAAEVLDHPFFKASRSSPAASGMVAELARTLSSYFEANHLKITQTPVTVHNAICCFDQKFHFLRAYDPAKKKWTKKQKLHKDMMIWSFTAAAVNDDIYVLMQNQQVHRLTRSDAGSKWMPIAPMIFSHGLWPPIVILYDTIYVIGKCGDSSLRGEAERYNPQLDAWSSVSDMKTMKRDHTLAATKGHIHCIGGWDGNKELTSVERFNPGDQSWSDVASMKTARCNTASAVLESKIFVLGLPGDMFS